MNWLTVIFIIAGVSLAFLLLREFVTWYWKMNEICAKQNLTNDLLNKQNELLKNNNSLLREFVNEFMRK